MDITSTPRAARRRGLGLARGTFGLALIVGSLQLATHVAASVQTTPARPEAVTGDVPVEYVIGPEDILAVVFWRDAEMSAEMAVRPDGKITLPLLGDIHAAGLTTVALKGEIEKLASKVQREPNVTVAVKQINSRKVFITGQVGTPGTFPLIGPRTVMQLISLAGGLTEYADKKNITVIRFEQGRQQVFKFNYSDVAKGKNLAQNIVLKPGDTVVVP